MATHTWDVAFVQANDTEFRTWGESTSDALAAIGLTQTADTGQINWTTVTAPVLAATSQGYEIWRFNDTAHSTTPIFMKFEWGSGTSTTTRAQMWLTIGTGSDGAGNLTGVLWGARAGTNTTDTGSTIQRNYACYNTDTGTFWMSLSPALAGWGAFMMISRGCNDAGTPGTEVVMTFRHSSVPSTGSWAGYRGDLAAIITNPAGGWSYPLSSGAGPFAYGPYIPAFYCYAPGLTLRLMTGYFGCGIYDFSPGGQTTIDVVNGISHNYIYLPTGSSGSPTGSSSGSSSKFLLIWE